MKRGVIAVLISAVCFGTISIFAKLLSGSLQSIAVISSRLFIATIFFFLFALIIKKKIEIKKSDLKFFVPYAFIGIFISMWAGVSAVYYTSIANVVFFILTYPVITVVMAAIFLKERITKIKLTATALGFVGIIILSVFQKDFSLTSNNFIGCMLALITAFAFSFYLIMTKLSKRPFYTETAGGMLFGLLFSIPFLIFMGGYSALFIMGTVDVLYLIGMGLIGTAGAYILLDYGEDYIEASKAGLIELSQAVVAIVLAFLVLNEVPELHTMVGGIFIISAAVLVLKQ